jgi:hypothetical protein
MGQLSINKFLVSIKRNETGNGTPWNFLTLFFEKNNFSQKDGKLTQFLIFRFFLLK